MRDRDSAADVRVWATSALGSVVGYLVGGAVGWAVAHRLGWPILPGVVAGALLFRVAVVGTVLLVIEGAGRIAGLIHGPRGSSTPHRPEYSRAAALAARGRLEEAEALYRAHIDLNPLDPVPCLRLARLLRDQGGRPHDAIRWFRAARDIPDIEEGVERVATREIIETWSGRLGDPAGAAPELSRLAERFPDAPEGRWARERLRELRSGPEGPV